MSAVVHSFGLHFLDIQHLYQVIHRITHEADTFIVIEPNLGMIKETDTITDCGQEGEVRQVTLLWPRAT